MAVNRRYVTNGQTVEETVWFKVKTYRNLAANCGKYLAKGSKVAVKGRVGQPEPYIGRDGKPYAVNVLFAENVEFLTTASGAAANQELDGAMAAASAASVVSEDEMMAASVDF
ncbi:MAG: single-stranded DNA-binding protein [Anaerolineae bacterium]|nr:single-stranded DNA-binding protein [Anaerolineae bacterium]